MSPILRKKEMAEENLNCNLSHRPFSLSGTGAKSRWKPRVRTTITSHQVSFSLYQQLVGDDDQEPVDPVIQWWNDRQEITGGVLQGLPHFPCRRLPSKNALSPNWKHSCPCASA